MGHIQLSRSADLLVVAPATADISRQDGGRRRGRSRLHAAARDRQARAGRAGDERPHVAASGDGREHGDCSPRAASRVVGPDEGAMACHEFGPGRLAEPPAILAAIEALLDARRQAARRQARAGDERADARADRPGALHRQPQQRAAGPRDRRGAGRARRARDAGQRPGRGAPIRPASSVRQVETAAADAGARARPPAGRRRGVRRRRRRLAGRERGRAEDQEVGRGAAAARAGAEPRHPRDASRAPARARPRLVVGFAAETDDVVANARGEAGAQGLRLDRCQRRVPATGIMGGAENVVSLVTRDGRRGLAAPVEAARSARRLAAPDRGALCRDAGMGCARKPEMRRIAARRAPD